MTKGGLNGALNKQSMMTSSNAYISRVTGPLCRNSPVTGEFPHEDKWRRASVFSLICAWTNGWVNNRDTGAMRCHCSHYDVTVMDSAIPHPHGGSLGYSWDCFGQNLDRVITWPWPCTVTKYISCLSLIYKAAAVRNLNNSPQGSK